MVKKFNVTYKKNLDKNFDYVINYIKFITKTLFWKRKG